MDDIKFEFREDCFIKGGKKIADYKIVQVIDNLLIIQDKEERLGIMSFDGKNLSTRVIVEPKFAKTEIVKLAPNRLLVKDYFDHSAGVIDYEGRTIISDQYNIRKLNDNVLSVYQGNNNTIMSDMDGNSISNETYRILQKIEDTGKYFYYMQTVTGTPYLRSSGVLNEKGESLLLSIHYQDIRVMPNGVIVAKGYNEAHNFYDIYSNNKILHFNHKYKCFAYYDDEKMLVCKKNKWIFLDYDGNKISNFKGFSQNPIYIKEFSQDPIYIRDFKNGLAIASYDLLMDKTHKSFDALIDKNGNLQSLFFDYIICQDGFIKGELNNKCTLLPSKNNNEYYKKIIPLNDSIAFVYLDGMYGMINKKGEIILPIIYDELEYMNDGIIKACLDDKYGLISKDGEVILDIKYSSIINYKNKDNIIVCDTLKNNGINQIIIDQNSDRKIIFENTNYEINIYNKELIIIDDSIYYLQNLEANYNFHLDIEWRNQKVSKTFDSYEDLIYYRTMFNKYIEEEIEEKERKTKLQIKELEAKNSEDTMNLFLNSDDIIQKKLKKN